MKNAIATAFAAAVLASMLSLATANAAQAKNAHHQTHVQTAPPHFDAAEFFATQYLRGGS